MRKTIFLFAILLFNLTLSFSQEYTQEDLCKLIEDTYSNFKEAQVYDETYQLSLHKEEQIAYTSIDWKLEKYQGISPEDLRNFNLQLEEQRKDLPSQSIEHSTYEYRMYGSRRDLINHDFKIVEGYNPSIEGAKLLQSILPDASFKFYRFGIRFTKDIHLKEGLQERKGSMVDFDNLEPYKRAVLISSINTPNYLKKTDRYTYTLEKTWEENGDEYLKITFQPNHKKESLSGYVVIQTSELVFTEIYAAESANCECNSIDEEPENSHHIIFKEHENTQFLPNRVTIIQHYECSFTYNAWSKFVSVKDETTPKAKFKLKGKEEYAKKVTSEYSIAY